MVRRCAGGPAVRCWASTSAVSGAIWRATATIGRKLLVDNAFTHARAIGVTAAQTAVPRWIQQVMHCAVGMFGCAQSTANTVVVLPHFIARRRNVGGLACL